MALKAETTRTDTPPAQRAHVGADIFYVQMNLFYMEASVRKTARSSIGSACAVKKAARKTRLTIVQPSEGGRRRHVEVGSKRKSDLSPNYESMPLFSIAISVGGPSVQGLCRVGPPESRHEILFFRRVIRAIRNNRKII